MLFRSDFADCVELIGPHTRKIEAGANGVVRKAGIVFDPADALLGHGKKQLAVPRDARGRIVHLRVVEAECDHAITRNSRAPRIHLRVSLQDEERMSFFNDAPVWIDSIPKKTID